jgi:hypothetical protein
VLDPLMRRLNASRPWRGVEDRELDARVDALPHAPPRDPAAGSPPARLMMTASKR